MGGSRQTNGMNPGGVGLGQLSSPGVFGLGSNSATMPSPVASLAGGAATPFGVPPQLPGLGQPQPQPQQQALGQEGQQISSIDDLLQRWAAARQPVAQMGLQRGGSGDYGV